MENCTCELAGSIDRKCEPERAREREREREREGERGRERERASFEPFTTGDGVGGACVGARIRGQREKRDSREE